MNDDEPGARRIVICDAASFDGIGAATIARSVADAIGRRGHCALALAGGSTPRRVYERLAVPPLREEVDWERVAIFFGDERSVPPDHEDSNYGMAAAALLRHVPIPEASIHRMEAERADRDAAARDYARLLPESLDVLVLGMGGDGHTASLFPHSDALAEAARRVVPARSPAPPHDRLTITPPVIRAAEVVIVLVAGTAKAGILARALEGSSTSAELPIRIVTGGTWVVDRDAARELRGQ